MTRSGESVYPFEGIQDRDEIRVSLKDGSWHEGSYLTQAGWHFVHVPGPRAEGNPVGGKVVGPILPGDVEGIVVLRTRQELLDELHDRKRGDPVPGTLRRTREGYEARLETLARVAARTDGFRRRQEIERQFDDVADEIELARTKRNWMLRVARWYRYNNEEPTKVDLSGGDMSMAQRFQRPRSQDFDPDPKIRRARVPVSPHVAADPISTVNMRKALVRAGFNARCSIVGEITDDHADLLVDFPGGKKYGRYCLTGDRKPDGEMEWSFRWEGNYTKTDMDRKWRCERSEAFQAFKQLVALGLEAPVLQPKPEEPQVEEEEPYRPWSW